MRPLELRIPPPLVAALLMAIMWLLPPMPEPLLLHRGARTVWAVVLVLVGQGIAVAGMMAFRRARTTLNPVRAGDASSLVRSGVYRFTRNPMYLGWALTIAAWALYLGNVITWAAVPAFVWYITRFQIKPEERILSQLFGSDFASYSSEVRRWI